MQHAVSWVTKQEWGPDFRRFALRYLWPPAAWAAWQGRPWLRLWALVAYLHLAIPLFLVYVCVRVFMGPYWYVGFPIAGIVLMKSAYIAIRLQLAYRLSQPAGDGGAVAHA